MIPICILAIEDDADRVFMITLYEQYRKAMYYRAFDVLKEHTEAEDAVHDALVRLISRTAMLRTMPKEQLFPYVIITAQTAAIDRWRSRGKVHLGADADIADSHCGTEKDRTGAFIDMERVDLLSRGLEKLTEQDRNILIYRYIMEMTDEEIAKQLGIKPESVRMYLTRARRNAFAVLDAEEV